MSKFWWWVFDVQKGLFNFVPACIEDGDFLSAVQAGTKLNKPFWTSNMWVFVELKLELVFTFLFVWNSPAFTFLFCDLRRKQVVSSKG